MAKFLATEGVSHALSEIVKRAQERLVLISPYLKVNPRIKELIEDKNRLKIDVRIIYGKEDPPPEEIAWLHSMTSVRTSFCKNLHAKCYLNENEALLTSMNLYSHSEVNNYEMGILVSREEDPGLYKEILEESRRIVRISKDSREPSGENIQPASKMPVKVYCIRCKEEKKPFFPKKRRYCSSCYSDWMQFSEKLTEEASFSHKEKYCHTCGNEYEASRRYPGCPECYEKYPDFYESRAIESV